MNTQEMTARIAELEQFIASKKESMSKTGFRSWVYRSGEYNEMIDLKTDLGNAQIKAKKAAPRRNWQNDQATTGQLNYLARLRVAVDEQITKGRASQLINAAKNDDLGSVGGFYTDGSN